MTDDKPGAWAFRPNEMVAEFIEHIMATEKVNRSTALNWAVSMTSASWSRSLALRQVWAKSLAERYGQNAVVQVQISHAETSARSSATAQIDGQDVSQEIRVIITDAWEDDLALLVEVPDAGLGDHPGAEIFMAQIERDAVPTVKVFTVGDLATAPFTRGASRTAHNRRQASRHYDPDGVE